MSSPDSSGQSGGDAGHPPPQGGDAPAPSGVEAGEPIFTQDQVNTLLRSERAKAAARYQDYDQIKSRLSEMEQAGQTELEKAQAKAREADLRAAAAVRDRDRLIVRSSVLSEAARAGAVDPEIVV